MKKSLVVLGALAALALSSTALAQSRYHSYRGALGNGRIDVPFLPQGTFIPLPVPIQGTWGGTMNIPFLPVSRSGNVYSTLLNGYLDVPLPSGTTIPLPIPIRGTLGNNLIDLPLPPF